MNLKYMYGIPSKTQVYMKDSAVLFDGLKIKIKNRKKSWDKN